MNIVILDAKTIGKDICLDKIRAEGNLEIFQTTNPTQTAARIKNADIVISNKVVIDKNEFETAQNLKLICVAATGYNNININEAKKQNVIVANVKGYSTESVAQQVFSSILTFYNSVIEYQNAIKAGKWQKSDVFTMLDYPIYELKGKIIGIIGYGAIGKRVAEIAQVFGMKILKYKMPGKQYKDENRVELNELLQNSDIVSIHCPLNENTKDMIKAEQISMMKKSAILINYARGGIVKEKDLHFALKNNNIKAAIVDVLTNEQPKDGNILLDSPNILVTPHIAWTSVEAREKLVEGIVENIRLFKQGKIDKIKL